MKPNIFLALAFFLAGCAYPTYTVRTGDVRQEIASRGHGFPLGSLTVRNNSGRAIVCDANLNRPVVLVLAPPTEVGPGEVFTVETRSHARVGASYSIEAGCVAAYGPHLQSAKRIWNFSDWGYSIRHELWYVEQAGDALVIR